MRIISIDAVRGGEILAEAIKNEQNDVLIPAGAVIREDYVPLIKSFGIVSLKIEDPYRSFEIPHPIMNPEKLGTMVNKVKRLMERHIYHTDFSMKEFEVIANELVRQIRDIPENVVYDIESREADLYEHTIMVTLLSLIIAKKLQFDEQQLFYLAIGCLLHDIGIRYITVPYENRDMETGSPAEVFEYKKHAILGYSAVEDEPWIPDICRKIILSHHERADGSGFPMRQRMKETECRIVQVCDAFDCMISGMECNRTNVWYAIEQIRQGAGTSYDRKIAQMLVEMVAAYPVGTAVVVGDQKAGIVVEQTNDPNKPVVMIVDEQQNGLLEKYDPVMQPQIVTACR